MLHIKIQLVDCDWSDLIYDGCVQGDSGSLLVCNSGGGQDSWSVVGLASWSLTNCAVTVYARVTSSVLWIQHTMLTIH